MGTERVQKIARGTLLYRAVLSLFLPLSCIFSTVSFWEERRESAVMKCLADLLDLHPFFYCWLFDCYVLIV